MADTIVNFRVNENDFITEESHQWFLDFHAKRKDKSKFYKAAVIPKIEATKTGKEEEFNRLMQLVGAVGVDFLLECYDNTMDGKGAIMDADQIQSIVAQTLKLVSNKGINIDSLNSAEIIDEVNSKRPSKEMVSNLRNLVGR